MEVEAEQVDPAGQVDAGCRQAQIEEAVDGERSRKEWKREVKVAVVERCWVLSRLVSFDEDEVGSQYVIVALE